MKKIIKMLSLVMLISGASLFCMDPISRGAYFGAAMGASVGASVGTFIVVNDAIGLSFFSKSREERALELLQNGSLFTVLGYTALGVAVGCAVGVVEGALVSGAMKSGKCIARDVKKNGIRSKSFLSAAGISAAALIAYALQTNGVFSRNARPSYR